MSSKSKAKGTRAETAVVKFLEGYGIEAARRALSGSVDHGDILVNAAIDMVIEVKAGKQTANPNRGQLEEWLRQAEVEASASNVPGILVVVRYNRKLCDADVYFRWRGMIVHLYLDEYAEFVANDMRLKTIG